jgi:tape measure domain-containing protein
MANGAKMMLKLGIDVSDLSRELGKVETAMSRFGSKMQSIGSTMTQSLTLPIIGIGTASLKAFADIEKLQNGLTAIMGSSEAAAVELEKLRKVAENPGLALPEVVKASSALQSVGMSADQARETITQFGNAVARSPKPDAETFSGVTLALAQMSAVGKVTQEDLNQLKERLPEFADVMKNEFGTATAEGIRSMGLSSEDFIKRTVSALSELERAKGGLGNAFDNLKDNVTASLAELGKTINESLKVEEAFSVLSNKLNSLVQGFKMLKPEIQGFLVYFGLAVAAIGPAIFIIGKLISTYGALAGAAVQVVKALGGINNALNYLAKNPQVLLITAAIAALGAIALYVYDNWKAFSDRFTNIWINIKNSVMSGVASVLKSIDNLQKSLGLKLFNLEGLTEYQKEQRIVATEFKSIGDTVDSLKGKLAGLFTTGAKTGGTGGGGGGIAPFTTGTAAAGGGGGSAASNEALTRGPAMSAVGMLPTLNLLPTSLRSVAAETDRAKEATDSFTKAQDAAGKAVEYTDERIENLKRAMQELNDGIKNIIENTITDLATALGDQLGNALAGAKFSIGALIAPLADALGAFGKLAIQTGITAAGIKLALKPPINPVVAIAGGVALLALSKLVKAKLPALAEGGLAFAPTMAMVGDNRNARVDPEVIAPLSKLKAMIGDGMGGGTLETRISGNDLIILLNRSQKNLSRVQ